MQTLGYGTFTADTTVMMKMSASQVTAQVRDMPAREGSEGRTRTAQTHPTSRHSPRPPNPEQNGPPDSHVIAQCTYINIMRLYDNIRTIALNSPSVPSLLPPKNDYGGLENGGVTLHQTAQAV